MLRTGEDTFKDKNDDFSSGSGRSSFRNMSPEKAAVIENIFQEVLGRKPSSREMSFYKYSVISEDEIRIKLLSGDEHKNIIEKALKLPSVEDQLRDSQLGERRLTQKINDIEGQITETNVLLNEKNREIEELREELQNPYNLVNRSDRYEEGFDIFSTPKVEKIKTDERRSFKDVLRDLLDFLIK